jgi:hypothetical protein
MKLHGFGVAGRQHEGGTGSEFRADRTEHIGRLRALVVDGPGVLRDNLDENGASIWMRRGGRGERQLTMAAVLARL